LNIFFIIIIEVFDKQKGSKVTKNDELKLPKNISSTKTIYFNYFIMMRVNILAG
jgi:hypothetical protein